MKHWIGSLLSWLVFGTALAGNEATLIVRQDLRDGPARQASLLGEVQAGRMVRVLEQARGWVRVETGGIMGWVRALSLKSLEGESVVRWQSSAIYSKPNEIVAVAGIRDLAPTKPTAHALVLTIADYKAPIPSLRGVSRDAEHGVLLARALGVSEDNILRRRDGQLTLAGFRSSLDELEGRLGVGDEAFIYFSGHGTRLPTGQPGACSPALLAADGQPLFDAEFAARLKRLSSKARRVVLFTDACHSGGMLARRLDSGQSDDLTSKYWAAGAGQDGCERPDNLLARSLNGKIQGLPVGNLVQIAAARADEVALDNGSRGGVLSLAWLDCLGGEARDLDGSGGLTAEELRRCAQPLVEKMVAGHKQFSPPHITLHGNQDMVLRGAISIDSTDTSEGGATADAFATLRDILASRDHARDVRFIADKRRFRIGHDSLDFGIRSDRAGYVYLLMVGSDGKTFDILFPNRLDEDNRIRAGETLHLPRPQWSLVSQGPAGFNHLLAIVSDAPRNFGRPNGNHSAPFTTLTAAGGGTRDIQLVALTPPIEPPSECARPGAQRPDDGRCSGGFGAALISLEEIP